MKKIIFLSFLSFVLSVCPAFSMNGSGTETDETDDGRGLYLGVQCRMPRGSEERSRGLSDLVEKWFATGVFAAVKSIDWSSSSLDSRDMAILAPGLQRMVNVKTIRINDNPLLGDEGVRVLADNLIFYENLEHLNLRKTGLTDEGASYILEKLNGHPSLRGVNLYGNLLTDRMVFPLCEFIPSCKEFAALNMGGNASYINEGDPTGDRQVFQFLQDQKYNIAHSETCKSMKRGRVIIQPPRYAAKGGRLFVKELFETYESYLR